MTITVVMFAVVLSTPQVGVADIIWAAADAYTPQANANANLGTSTELRTGCDWGGRTRSFLKFDLSAYTGIASATLWLRTRTESNGAGEGDIAVYFVSDDSWTETGITYTTQPPHDATATDTRTASFVQNTYYSWDVTSLAQASLSDDTLSVVLISATDSTTYTSADFYSRNMGGTGSDPYLDVTVPEPATMALLMLGLPLALRRRRK